MLVLASFLLFPAVALGIRCYTGTSVAFLLELELPLHDVCIRHSVECSTSQQCNGSPPGTIIQNYRSANKSQELSYVKAGRPVDFPDMYICDTPLCNTRNATANNLFPVIGTLGCFLKGAGGNLEKARFYTETPGDIGCYKTESNQGSHYSWISREEYVKAIGTMPLRSKIYYTAYLYCTTDFCNSAEAKGITDENLWGTLLTAPSDTTPSPQVTLKVNASAQSKAPMLSWTLIAIFVSVLLSMLI
jgi:hypothetical protein